MNCIICDWHPIASLYWHPFISWREANWRINIEQWSPITQMSLNLICCSNAPMLSANIIVNAEYEVSCLCLSPCCVDSNNIYSQTGIRKWLYEDVLHGVNNRATTLYCTHCRWHHCIRIRFEAVSWSTSETKHGQHRVQKSICRIGLSLYADQYATATIRPNIQRSNSCCSNKLVWASCTGKCRFTRMAEPFRDTFTKGSTFQSVKYCEPFHSSTQTWINPTLIRFIP